MPRRWGRAHRHLWTDSRLQWLMMAYWLGCLRWSRHNWMQE